MLDESVYFVTEAAKLKDKKEQFSRMSQGWCVRGSKMLLNG